MDNLPDNTTSSKFSSGWTLSLRTKLILSYILITIIAITGLGYYIYGRILEANTLISSQLDSTVRQQAESTLTLANIKEANNLNKFFTSITNDMTVTGATVSSLLSKEGTFDNGVTWDASKSLSRSGNGSWDNSNSETASVFVPAKGEITNILGSELTSLRQLDIVAPAILHEHTDVVAIYFGGVSGETVYYPNIDLASLIPPDFDVTQRPWFVDAAPSKNPNHKAVWSDPYLDAAQHGLIVTNSLPIYDAAGNFRGVIAMDIRLNTLSDLVSNINIGMSGFGLLIDKNKRLIATSAQGYKELGITTQSFQQGEVLDPSKLSNQLPANLFETLTSMSKGQNGLNVYSISGVERFIVYAPLPDVGYSLAMIVPSPEWLSSGATLAKERLSESTTNTLQASFVLDAVILMVAVLAGLWIGNTLTSPLIALTQTAVEIIDGNLNAEADVRGHDEIGTLASTLNAMTATLRDSILSLEQRVKDRTAALEILSESATRRASQFETITQVTSAITSIRKMDELMPLIASVISNYFGFYHVGIFLNDEYGQNTILIAANSEGGRRMLQRNHSLRIGSQGIVGYVAARGESRVARNVGDDIVFFNNPDLPETKSEAALPLRSGASIIGVLDVQSIEEDAFSQEDINILGILADQVGLAIENSRLFETTRRSLTEAETLYRQYLHEGWSRLPLEEQVTGYRYTPRGAAPILSDLNVAGQNETPGIENVDHTSKLSIPIKLRGETIGNLIVRAPEGKYWRQDQIDLIRAVADRVALSAENARLFDETSRRAERERLVTEITSKIRSTNDPEEMIKTALEELRSALGATQIEVIPQVVPGSPTNVTEASYSAHGESSQKTQRGNGANR